MTENHQAWCDLNLFMLKGAIWWATFCAAFSIGAAV